MRFILHIPTPATPPARALLCICGLLIGFAAPVGAAEEYGRTYAEARRKADLEHSEAQRECARMEPELKTECMARGKARLEARLSAARERFPDTAAPPLDAETAARFERDLGECDRLSSAERPGCRLDVQRRYRH